VPTFLKITHARIAARTAKQIEPAPCLAAREDGAGGLALAHVGGFAPDQEVVARRREEIDHLSVFAEPSFVLYTSRNDHDVARGADPLFAAEAEFHLALEHPSDLLICVIVRLDMDPRPRCSTTWPAVSGESEHDAAWLQSASCSSRMLCDWLLLDVFVDNSDCP
jgi:hypothetical protein